MDIINITEENGQVKIDFEEKVKNTKYVSYDQLKDELQNMQTEIESIQEEILAKEDRLDELTGKAALINAFVEKKEKPEEVTQ